MDGILSMLDEEHQHYVEGIWAQLDREFALHGIYASPFPHFTYQVAEHYEVEKVESALGRLAAAQPCFGIKTAGLGVFTGPNPVIYISVVRSLQLSQFHRVLWEQLGDTGQGVNNHYRPEDWVPHITLAYGDVDNSMVPHVIRFLSNQNFYWQMPVQALSLVYSTGTEYGLRNRREFPLGC